MRRIVVASGIAIGLIAGTSLVAACSSCADPDLLAGGPSVGPTPLLTADDIEEGFYVVTKGFTGNTVTTTGDTTTYSFTTADVTQPTTVARDVSVVGTGQASFADGTSSNARPTLKDGRAVAGTYVDSYTVDASGNKVWFDRTFLPDDSELAKDAAAPATPAPSETDAATTPQVTEPEPAQPSTPSASDIGPSPYDGAPPDLGPWDTVPADLFPPEPDLPTPREPRSGEPEPGKSPGLPARPPAPPSSAPSVRAGVALARYADVLSEVEILRGRRIRLWIKATVAGSPSRVLAWHLVSGEVTALGPRAGTGDDPFVAEWVRVGLPGETFVVRFDAVVDLPGGATATAPALLAVSVRSPALVE